MSRDAKPNGGGDWKRLSTEEQRRVMDVCRRARTLPLELGRVRVEQELGAEPDLAAEALVILGLVTKAERAGYLESRVDPLIGKTIGPYRVERILGGGGMGTVYEAVQVDPIGRKVAIKVIRAEVVTDVARARFVAEGKSLARMQHPNIAAVFDAGSTPERRPYLVMEYVDGLPITEACDSHQLGIRERLDIFQQVCEAVQHAHRRGIIHRDLKPGNILVTRIDGALVPKIIDFGIARVIDPESDEPDSHRLTGPGQPIGTPEYMSPEQAEGSRDIDTATDIYSLGVVLYELLAGAPPFEASEVRRDSWAETARFLRTHEPPLPSTRFELLASKDPARAAAIAEARATSPRELVRALRHELERIPAFAMRKDRSLRYRSVGEFAEDIAAFRAGRALRAGPETAMYRIAKFVRSHRLAVAVGATSVAAFLICVAAIGYGYRVALREQHNAESAQAFFNAVIEATDPQRGGDREISITDALDRSLAALSNGVFADAPLIRIDFPNLIGRIHESTGSYPQAEAHYRAALAAQLEVDPTSDKAAIILSNLASCLTTIGRAEEAESLCRRALDVLLEHHDVDHPTVLMVQNNRATALQRLERLQEAADIMQACVAGYSRRYGESSHLVAVSRVNLASILQDLGRLNEAEQLGRKALAALESHADSRPLDISWCLNNLANVLQHQNRLADALLMNERALTIVRNNRGEIHVEVVRLLNNGATMLSELGRLDEAIARGRESIAICRRLDSRLPLVRTTFGNVALMMRSGGEYAEAEQLLRENLQVWERHTESGDPGIRSAKLMLADVLIDAGKAEEAERWIDSAVDRSRCGGVAAALLGAAISAQGRFEEAEPFLLAGYDSIKDKTGYANGQRRRDTLSRLVALYESWEARDPGQGKAVEAAKWRATLQAEK